MSAWPNNKRAQRALILLRKHGSKPGCELYPLVWEFVHRMTAGRFRRLSDFLLADMEGEEDTRRDEVISVIIQALESGDHSLLDPAETFAGPATGTA